MIWPLFGRRPRSDTISILYGTIVAQARLPEFYRDYGVADTINGRFDLIILHLTMVLGRLGREPTLAGLGQSLFDRFCRDMDDNLREMGVGDLSVPKEMRRMGEAFYGRAQAYRDALASASDEAFVEAIGRNVYGGIPSDKDAPRRLAIYVRQALRDLDHQGSERLSRGTIDFPDPLSVLVGRIEA